MIAKVFSALPYGYGASIIEVEGDSNNGLPIFTIVGMANKTIDESRERVRSALINSGFSFPRKKIIINLAPAELQKDGSYLDLPIALSVLILSRQLLFENIHKGTIFIGELSLTGELRPVLGIIGIIEAAKKSGFLEIFIPQKNLPQASLISGISIVGVRNLKELFMHLKGETKIRPQKNVVINKHKDKDTMILDHVYGQKQAKRALVIAIAGRHNLLISGPPGAGKTMLAKTAIALLPKLSNNEKITVTKIHSLAGATASDNIVHLRPFRHPHHSASLTAIIGGGPKARPGEISLSHLGVLFLDELAEYPKQIIESLRQPLEDKQITISRSRQKATYPADFLLIATTNPCPCGFFGSPDRECICSPHQLSMYAKKLSGPIMDRIDMVISVPKVEISSLLKNNATTSQEHDLATRQIQQAIELQQQRYQQNSKYNTNLSSHEINIKINISKEAKLILDQAAETMHLSARAYFKTIKVAQTIADLEQSAVLSPKHISEALQYRKR